MRENLVCALLCGEADSEKKALEVAESYKNCPYVNFMATKEKLLFASFFLPEKQLWWIQYVGINPKETFGLEKATITVVDHVECPKWLKMRLPRKLRRISPCGSNCKECHAYERCTGCPATIFYKT